MYAVKLGGSLIKYAGSVMAVHRMAIAAMEQYGMFLSDISGVKTASSMNKIKTPCIFLPHGLKKHSSLPGALPQIQ